MKPLALIGLFWTATLLAAPVENTLAPQLIQKGLFSSCDQWVDVRMGYEGDFIADGRMQQYEQGSGRVDLYDQITNSGTVTLNFLKRIDIYGVFGGSRTKADWRITDPAEVIHRIKTKTATSFLWGVGARAIYYEWYCLAFGMGARYSSFHSHPIELTFDGIPEPTEGATFRWREWQVNLDFSYKISLFTPYIGCKYANARTELHQFSVPISNSGTGSDDFKNRVPVGLYLGCALSTGDYVMFNVEGRLIDEEAVTVSGDIRF